ncbi:F-box/kelch-repeat protein At1g80440-like [Gastrolobium bilobum]|uniref:F-box/kelch-repeat protein At1g80440-like n=1 Tax=Gastrolobium bilobum TaxID=150636 RepID=UPI002AB141BD|nr:F-box/kelch-repeat protein At1g80440-like [Gastrolobium bilobum]
MMELISGLPDDVARDCLIRVSYQQFSAVASVCKGWNTEIQMPEFRRRRRTTGHSEKIFVTVQSRVDSDKRESGLLVKAMTNPVFRLSVFEPETGIWSELPMAPEFHNGLPMFCQIAGVGYDLVIMGGWDPDSWKASNSVFIYNFLSAKWRRGADMPGGPRTFFACASDYDRTVYVAGGHDEEKNALRSAFAYDVARDVWVPLPDMARERDECKAVFRRDGGGSGTLRVVGGYRTEMQGRFEPSAEAFDVDAWKWSPLEEEFLDGGACPRTCVDGGDEEGRMYMCRGGDVVELKGNTWQTVAKVPGEIRNVACVGAWEGALLLIGSSGLGEPHMGFLLDLKSGAWAKLDSPDNYTGHVQSGCLLEI